MELDAGLHKIQERERRYKDNVKNMYEELHDVLIASETLTMPDCVQKAAIDHNEQLKFPALEKKKKAEEKKLKDQNMADLVLLPSEKYSLGYLRSRGVIWRMGTDRKTNSYLRSRGVIWRMG